MTIPLDPTEACARLEALIAKWRTDADAIDADGDICCAMTRQHDADALEAALQGRAVLPRPPTEEDKNKDDGVSR